MAKFFSNFTIKINGANVAEGFYDALKEVNVDSTLGMPCMATIQMHDHDLKWVDDTSLDLGKSLEISAVQDEVRSGGSNTPTLLFKGEITAIEPHFLAMGNTELTIRGYDKSHRLHRGRKTRTFLKMSDSDIVSKIAGEAGLSVSSDATSIIFDYVIQYNQTNMEFLLGRAERIGYQVYVSDATLYFKKGNNSGTSVTTLNYLEELYKFEPRMAAHHQADKVIVRSWDVKQKQLIESQVTPDSSLNQGGMTGTGGSLTMTAFSSAEEIIVDQPAFTVDEAESIATGMSNDIDREFLQADGVCEGNPVILAGCKITVAKVGTRFSGAYFVTSATHIKTAEKYETHFSITGRYPNTLSSIILPNGESYSDTSSVNGVVTGLVTNLNDPDDIGRVKVKYAWLGEIESDWMRIATPMAGPARGMEILPEVNDEVLIAFEHGDIHRPYIVGVLWSATDKPVLKNSEATLSGKVNQRIFKTRKGHTMLFDDKDGEEKISIKSKSGHELILDDKSGSEAVTIKDKGGNTMVIDSTKNSLTIKVTGDFNVEATGKITMKSTQDMSLTATTNVKVEGTTKTEVKGTTVSINGTGQTEVKGATVSVNGSATTEVKGGAMVQVQGAIVKIN